MTEPSDSDDLAHLLPSLEDTLRQWYQASSTKLLGNPDPSPQDMLSMALSLADRATFYGLQEDQAYAAALRKVSRSLRELADGIAKEAERRESRKDTEPF